MSQEKKRPIETLKEWWSVVLIVVAILGGYWWLERTYARIDKLDGEKCRLSYQIRLMKENIDFTDVDKEIEQQRTEVETLLKLANPPAERVEYKKGLIDSLGKRLERINAKKECLNRARGRCFEDADTDKCYERSRTN